MQPVRGNIHVAAGLPENYESLTLRDAAEWWKNAQRLMQQTQEEFGPITKQEMKTVNQSWIELCSAIAKREGVPTGMISYFVGDLAQSEMRAAKLAEDAVR